MHIKNREIVSRRNIARIRQGLIVTRGLVKMPGFVQSARQLKFEPVNRRELAHRILTRYGRGIRVELFGRHPRTLPVDIGRRRGEPIALILPGARWRS